MDIKNDTIVSTRGVSLRLSDKEAEIKPYELDAGNADERSES